MTARVGSATAERRSQKIEHDNRVVNQRGGCGETAATRLAFGRAAVSREIMNDIYISCSQIGRLDKPLKFGNNQHARGKKNYVCWWSSRWFELFGKAD